MEAEEKLVGNQKKKNLKLEVKLFQRDKDEFNSYHKRSFDVVRSELKRK
jgi:hypothetical protein